MNFKVGDAVQTRDGRKARIICDDLHTLHFPLAVAVTEGGGIEVVSQYPRDGRFTPTTRDDRSDLVPASKKRTVWVALWAKTSHTPESASACTSPYSIAEAKKDGALACVKVEINEGDFYDNGQQ